MTPEYPHVITFGVMVAGGGRREELVSVVGWPLGSVEM